MKLAALYGQDGGTRLHVALAGGYAAVDKLAAMAEVDELRGVRDVGDLFLRGPDVVEALRSLDAAQASLVRQDEARLAPPVVRPGKIICVGLNYSDHIAETRSVRPERLVLFAKFASCLLADGEPIHLPELTSQLDYEGELAVIMGARCTRVKAVDAMEYVGGYTIVNDVSARDLQSAEPQWVRGKALDGFAPLGPVVLHASAAPDVENMHIKTFVNGELRQDASCGLMLVPVPDLIEYISAGITLEPGDIIATGTPSGIGAAMTPPRFLQSGDTVTIEVDPIGALTNVVQSEITSA